MTKKQLKNLGKDMMEIESELSPNIRPKYSSSAKIKLYSEILDEIEKLSKWVYDNAAILPFSGSKVGSTKVVTTVTYGYGEQKLRDGIRDIISKLSL